MNEATMEKVRASYNVHEHYKDKTFEELREITNSDRINLSICLMNLEYDLNIGNCIRTAHVLGIKNVFIFGKSRFDSRSCVGAHNYLNIIKIPVEDMEDDNEILTTFRNMVDWYKLSPVMIDKTDKSFPLDFGIASYLVEQKSMCLVFGNEGKGIPQILLDCFHCHRHIHQSGVLRSMNVSSAAAIAMYHYADLMGY